MIDAPPPPPPATSLPPWAMYAGGAAVALVVAGFSFGWFGGGDSTAASGQPLVTFANGSTTSSAASATSSSAVSSSSTASTSAATTIASSTSSTGATTTSTSTTSTTTTTTTTLPAVLLDEKMDGTSAAEGYFTSEFMEVTVGQGALRIVGKYAGVLPALYPDAYPDSTVTMWFLVEPHNVNAFFGAIVMADDPADGLERYVLVYVKPTAYTIGASRLDSTIEGYPFVDDAFVTIPDGAAFTTREWHKLTMVVAGNSVDLYLNDRFAMTWTGAIPPLPQWWWGPMIVPGDTVATSGSPDVMLVDNVKLEPIG